MGTPAHSLNKNITAILADTGSTLDTEIGTIDTVVDSILTDTGTTLPGTLGTPADTDLATDIANVASALAVVDGIVDTLVASAALTASFSSVAAANAGYVAGLTASGVVIVEDIWIVGDAGGDATASAIEVGDAGFELIDATDAAAANLAAATDVVGATSGAVPRVVLNTQTIGIDHTGTGATAVALTVYVKYRSVAGGTLA